MTSKSTQSHMQLHEGLKGATLLLITSSQAQCHQYQIKFKPKNHDFITSSLSDKNGPRYCVHTRRSIR